MIAAAEQPRLRGPIRALPLDCDDGLDNEGTARQAKALPLHPSEEPLRMQANIVRARSRLCKQIILAENDELEVSGAVQPWEGSIRTEPINSMRDLADLLSGFGS